MTKDKNYKVKDAIVVTSLEEVLEELKNMRKKIFMLSEGKAFTDNFFRIVKQRM